MKEEPVNETRENTSDKVTLVVTRLEAAWLAGWIDGHCNEEDRLARQASEALLFAAASPSNIPWVVGLDL